MYCRCKVFGGKILKVLVVKKMKKKKPLLSCLGRIVVRHVLCD